MTNEEQQLLQTCSKMCAANPRLFSHIISACTEGIEGRVSEERARASDFETVAVAYAALAGEKRVSAKDRAYYQGLVDSKLDKWRGKSSMNWGA